MFVVSLMWTHKPLHLECNSPLCEIPPTGCLLSCGCVLDYHSPLPLPLAPPFPPPSSRSLLVKDHWHGVFDLYAGLLPSSCHAYPPLPHKTGSKVRLPFLASQLSCLRPTGEPLSSCSGTDGPVQHGWGVHWTTLHWRIWTHPQMKMSVCVNTKTPVTSIVQLKNI